jgi:hypothetical protein
LTYTKASGSVFALGTTTVGVTATDAAGNQTLGSFTVTVNAGPPVAVAFATNAQALTVGKPSAPITVELLDSFGNVTQAAGAGVALDLGTDSGGGAFLSAGQPITGVTIPQGSSTASFDYTDTNVGSPTLTVGGANLQPAQQQEGEYIPPTVTTSPADETVDAGVTATFTAAGAGTDLGVQWQKSIGGGPFLNIPLVNSAIFSFRTDASDDGDRFQAVFSNPVGAVTTAAATLNVKAIPPVVVTDPSSQTARSGETVSFTAGARGFPTPSVEWLVLNRGATTFQPVSNNLSTDPNILTLIAQATQTGNEYKAVFTNGNGSVTTTPATLTVSGNVPAGVLLTYPAEPVLAGSRVTFTARGIGTPAPAVQWQVSFDGGNTFSNIAGATRTTLRFQAQTGQDLFQYRAAFMNRYGVAYTDAATLTVASVSLAAPSVTTQPQAPPTAVNAGQHITLTAAASQAAAVQWQMSNNGGPFSAIAGAVSTSYTFVAQARQNGFRFRALFTNPAGSTPSDYVTLAVNPTVTLQPVNQSAYAGQTVTFTSAAIGNPTPTVLWQVSSDGQHFSDVANATASSLTVIASTGLLYYRAVFTDTVGTIQTQSFSRAAVLNSRPLPTRPIIITQPVDQTALANQAVSLTAATIASPSLSVQWYVRIKGTASFVPVQGNGSASTDTLMFTASSQTGSQYGPGNQYRAVFSAGTLSVTSSAATLTMATSPTITATPADRSIPIGNSVTFSAAANGSPAGVRWQVSADGGLTYTDISGARQPRLTFTARAIDDGNLYRAVFTNAVGQAITSPAALVVLP